MLNIGLIPEQVISVLLVDAHYLTLHGLAIQLSVVIYLHGLLGVIPVYKHHFSMTRVDQLKRGMKNVHKIIVSTSYLCFFQGPNVAKELLDVLHGDAGLQVLDDHLGPLQRRHALEAGHPAPGHLRGPGVELGLSLSPAEDLSLSVQPGPGVIIVITSASHWGSRPQRRAVSVAPENENS